MTMTSAASVDLAGRRVLVVEDQFLIAMDIEKMLRALGAANVDLASSIADALAAIERTPPDLAALDLRLGTETTAPVAEALQARSIPLVYVTGYDDLNAIPAPLRNAPLVRKPIHLGVFSAALSRLTF
jgi:CheY-like chemotaxis protein